MHRLVPQLILEKLKEGEEHGRFPAVVLFVDTSGFTALSTQLITHGKEGAELLAEMNCSLT